MKIYKNKKLAEFCSFNCGGIAEKLIIVENSDELIEVLKNNRNNKLHILGYGTNSLLSDKGLKGLTISTRGGEIKQLPAFKLVADAGVWWDDLVIYAIDHGLWGIELMSGIPGSVGAAAVGNIGAYGQSVSDSLLTLEVLDLSTGRIFNIGNQDLNFAYRTSKLKNSRNLIVTKVEFQLSDNKKTDLKYQSAVDFANQNKLDANDLNSVRKIIMGVRKRAGSLYDYRKHDSEEHTAGSYFKNPLTDLKTADYIMSFEESNRTIEQIKASNLVHGGDSYRVPASLVLLAAGFKRGQTWGDVRLHPDHILKIQNIGQATSKDILDVVKFIKKEVKKKLNIDLESEVELID